MTVAIEIGTRVETGSTGGLTGIGEPALLDLEELLSTRLLVQGNSGSGKSHLLRRLLEQSAAWVQQAVIDPEGDFVSLAERFGHLVIDAAEHDEAGLAAAGERMRTHRVPVVLNLEGIDAEQQMRRASAFLGGMFDAPRESWYPVLVVVDEAQLFAPAVAGEVSDEARRASLGAMTNLMCRGRKRGLAGVIATQRLAKLAKNVAAEATNFLMGRTFLDIDMARAADLLGMERRQAESFRDLGRGRFVALGPALSRRPITVGIGAVVTESRSAGPGLLPLAPAASEKDMRELILTPPSSTGTPRPRRMPGPPPPDILAQLSAHGATRASAPGLPDAGDGGLTRASPVQPTLEDAAHDRQRMQVVLRAMLADHDAEPEAGFRPVHVLYQDFLVRCRIEGLGRDALDLAGFRKALATARAGLDEVGAEAPDWQAVIRTGASLPEDVQGVFLLVAQAAHRRLPCPSDLEIARAYGTHSTGRARRQLHYLEERDVLVLRQDATGRRIAVIVGPGWETLPGAAA
ncbi:helicase HerA domain-containing protein [Lichenicola sp.]|uniref:helicase HerA domain-containing protein n=1 Tax=Lichenicola sp. TaxID=2804529 RepID=UPI003B000A9D